MAKTIEQLSNKIRIKWNTTTGLYHLYFGNTHVFIEGIGPIAGFTDVDKARKYGNRITQLNGSVYCRNNRFTFKTTTI